MDVYQNLSRLGIQLPAAPARGGVYASVKPFSGGKLLYVSGCGPNTGDRSFAGKVGEQLTLEEGQEAARSAMLNFLALVEQHTGDLNRVKSVVKLLFFVASANNFYSQPSVANQATLLLRELFGEETGVPARSAVGVSVLPGNIPVEVEGLIEL